MQISSTIVKDSVVISQRFRIRNTIWPSNPITGYVPKGLQIILLWRHMYTYVCCNIVYNSKDLESTQMPVNDRLDKENVAHIHHGIHAAIKEDEFMSFTGTQMKLETIFLSKLTQEQKTKHCMFSLISGSWTMRTHGYREWKHHTLGLSADGGIGEGQN